MLVDHAIVREEGDEAAAQVTPEGAETQAPQPRLDTAAAGALHPRLDQLAAVGTRDCGRVRSQSRRTVDHYHSWGRLLRWRRLLVHRDSSRWGEPLLGLRGNLFVTLVRRRLSIHDDV